MELIAQGGLSQQRWRRRLPENACAVVGRTAGGWAVPWDEQISRRHVSLTVANGQLRVQRMSAARNPVFLDGQEVSNFTISPGQHFVIGSTTFTLSNVQVTMDNSGPVPINEQRFTADFLRQARYRNAEKRIDALGRLPDLIKGAADDSELLQNMVNVLLSGIPSAQTIAIVAVRDHETDTGQNEGPLADSGNTEQQQAVEVLHWDRRDLAPGDFRPSERLIRQAVSDNKTVLHLWEGDADASAFTQREDMDWAFCTPLPGDASHGWAIYASGELRNLPAGPSGSNGSNGSERDDFRDDLKFAESAAAMFGNLQDIKMLQRENITLSQFFSPVVFVAIADQDPTVALAPKEAEVSVLFCDLSGFSRLSEQFSHDLHGLLDRVSKAMGVMTKHILANGGVVGDFQGDAAMGFWGWPLRDDHAARNACKAALAIAEEFAIANSNPSPLDGSQPDHLRGFSVTMGITSGPAIAGKIGTVDQVKVTVFGPTVNLASRLEGMTKRMGVNILIDEGTAEFMEDGELAQVSPIAVVKPYGMNQLVRIHELLSPLDGAADSETVAKLLQREQAFQWMARGDWDACTEVLNSMPASDRTVEFLLDQIAAENTVISPEEGGFIELRSK